jgi:hypothetical protein
MKAIKSFSLENLLLKILLDVSTSARRDILLSIVSNHCAQAFVDLAVANNIDKSIFAVVSQILPEQKKYFVSPLDCGGIQGFRNAETFRLQHEAMSILSNFTSSNYKIALVKGNCISSYYPVNLFRQQNDIDIAVGSFSDLVELYKVMSGFDYIPRILAVRVNEQGELEGSLSMVRVDQLLNETLWCDIWIGVQPISFTEAKQLDECFWEETVITPSKIRIPSASESLLILLNEIKERNSLRYRDVFDFLSILENGFSSDKKFLDIDTSQHKNSIDVCFSIASRNREIISNIFVKWQESCLWKQSTSIPDLEIELPIKVTSFEEIQPTENLEPEHSMMNGVFTRFLACAGNGGDFAIARLNSKLVVRTPIGCFISESSS